MYTCGPTLYDWQHIGNLRTFLLTDILVRTLRSEDYRVKSVMNVTDVEDKIIKALGDKSLAEFTSKFFDALRHDMQQVNIESPKWAKATDQKSIDHMAELIEKIMDKGLAYESEGSIYLSVGKYSNQHAYGVLQPIKIESLQITERIADDEYDKDSPQDFALWKAHKPGEPSWDITIQGKKYTGRPGWHIECSAMSELELGKEFDIHLGGVDLLFPHHENEIAQSEAANDKLLAKYWLHGEMLLVEGQKMSKSLGNIITLQNVVDKGFNPLTLRLLFMQAHYRSQMNFTWEALEAAQANLLSLQAWADLVHQEASKLSDNDAKSLLEDIKTSLSEDLNTAGALAALNGAVLKGRPSVALLNQLDDLLGLGLAGRPDITSSQKQVIKAREDARTVQDWETADHLRKQLAEQGIEVKDSDQKTTWSRV